jgi:hypothetical protein
MPNTCLDQVSAARRAAHLVGARNCRNDPLSSRRECKPRDPQSGSGDREARSSYLRQSSTPPHQQPNARAAGIALIRGHSAPYMGRRAAARSMRCRSDASTPRHRSESAASTTSTTGRSTSGVPEARRIPPGQRRNPPDRSVCPGQVRFPSVELGVELGCAGSGHRSYLSRNIVHTGGSRQAGMSGVEPQVVGRSPVSSRKMIVVALAEPQEARRSWPGSTRGLRFAQGADHDRAVRCCGRGPLPEHDHACFWAENQAQVCGGSGHPRPPGRAHGPDERRARPMAGLSDINDDARHLSTMSRVITGGGARGFEPPTFSR